MRSRIINFLSVYKLQVFVETFKDMNDKELIEELDVLIDEVVSDSYDSGFDDGYRERCNNCNLLI